MDRSELMRLCDEFSNVYAYGGDLEPVRTIARVCRSLLTDRERSVSGPDEYGSVYVWFQHRKNRSGVVAKTVRHKGEVMLDYDHNGKLYGMELLDVPTRMAGTKCAT